MTFEIIDRVLNTSNLPPGTDDSLEEEIMETQEELNNARKYFNSVSDPELVDYATYILKAAESKHAYLLKKKKDKQN
ncbi:DUF2508 family protein [Halanaerobaculum tunisiense]